MKPDKHANQFAGEHDGFRIGWLDKCDPPFVGWWWTNHTGSAHGPFPTSRAALMNALKEKQQ